MAEYRGFVFSVFFIILFLAMLGSAPSDLIVGYSNPSIEGINPQLLSGFSETETYNASQFPVLGSLYYYDYSLGGYAWRATYQDGVGFKLGSKVLFFGLWFGAIDYETMSFKQEDRGTAISFAELIADNVSGQVRYDLSPIGGGWIFAWNTTRYASPVDAWNYEELTIVHGIGVADVASGNVLSLVLGLLFFQLPDVPFLVNILIAGPIWVNIAYLIWFLIKEVIPFV